MNVLSYDKRIDHYGWGGGSEIAVFCHLFHLGVYVYELLPGPPYPRLQRVADFGDGSQGYVHLLYVGSCHYDLILGAPDPLV